MEEELIEKTLKLRIVVGYLIESENWWNTKFFDPTSKDFLDYIFPKSKNDKSVFFIDAFRYLTDMEVGANYYHLFRLPIKLEEQLYKKVRLSIGEVINSKEHALSILHDFSESLNIEKKSGPINIGESNQFNIDTIQAIAAHYDSGFKNNYKVHPYLN